MVLTVSSGSAAVAGSTGQDWPTDVLDLTRIEQVNSLFNSQLEGSLRVFLDGLAGGLTGLADTIAQGLETVASGLGQTAFLTDHQMNLSVLLETGSESVSDYLAVLSALLEDDEADAVTLFVTDLAAKLSGAGAGSDADRAFQAAMGRLRSVRQLSAEASVEVTVRAEAQASGAGEEADPLVLDLSGDGIALTGVEAGALFDINGDGRAERTSFVQGDDAFLALDRNGNGRVDDGRELFGDQNGAANGFEELARYDENGDGRIDGEDPVFDRLRVYQDRNRNGRTDPGELRRLDEAGVDAIGVTYRQTDHRLGSGDRVVQRGTFTRTDGTSGSAADAMVRYLDVTV